ncbi:MAG: rhodanese-like domain-containing protein [Candidatus Woesearchaeota archaeon]
MLTVQDVREMRARGDDFLLLDVRSREEFRAGHVEGALNVPLNEISDHTFDDRFIVVMCRTDNRARVAKRLLEKDHKVDYMKGGYLAWSQYFL